MGEGGSDTGAVEVDDASALTARDFCLSAREDATRKHAVGRALGGRSAQLPAVPAPAPRSSFSWPSLIYPFISGHFIRRHVPKNRFGVHAHQADSSRLSQRVETHAKIPDDKAHLFGILSDIAEMVTRKTLTAAAH